MQDTIAKQKESLPLLRFQKSLESTSGKKLKVKINDNRSTMLSVRWEPDLTRVSLHRMFLQAPRNVMDALACYISGAERNLAPSVKAFIEKNVQRLDYSHNVDPKCLCKRGRVYDLEELYNEINAQYFDDKLHLFITWFEPARGRGRSKITLGLYQDPLKLIKIHKILDSREIPDYVIRYVIYHEMLHAVERPYVDDQGVNRIHTPRFKALEGQFEHYALAKKWILANRGSLFDEI